MSGKIYLPNISTELTGDPNNAANKYGDQTGQDLYNSARGAHVVPGLDFKLKHAIDQIYNDYGDVVTIKPKSLAKFGSNLLVGTSYATLMTLPAGVTDETYISTNGITHISSSDAGDTQAVKIEGHTISGSDLTFVVQSTTLDGQNKVALTTPLARVTRVYNDDSTDFAGSIYVYEDDTVSAGVPTTNSKVHLIVPIGENQSFKGATAVSSVDYWLLTGMAASVNEKTAATVDVELQIRMPGKVFRTQFNFTVASTGSNSLPIELDPVIIVPKNSDVRMRAKASTNNVSVSGRMKGYLALISS